MKKLLVLLTVIGALAAASSASGSGTGSIVVSQLFAAGGNSGASYANDYVELFNRGTSAVSLTGWTLQYASSASSTWQTTALTGSVPAGGHVLVGLASGGTNGLTLPTTDASGTSNLAVTGGKVAVVRNGTALSCGSSAGSCSAVSAIEDFVGYGSAVDYEGTDAAPAPSATKALVRAGSGCNDADDNSGDFAAETPTPHNSASANAACSSSGDGGTTGGGTVGVDLQPVISLAVDHDTLNFGAVMPGTTPDPLTEHVTVTSSNVSGYSLTVDRSAFTPHDLPLGIGVGSGALAAVPISPDPDLLLGSKTGASVTGGDVWTTNVGFVSPLPALPSGHYTATITYTVIAG
jgi:hypothetical protein